MIYHGDKTCSASHKLFVGVDRLGLRKGFNRDKQVLLDSVLLLVLLEAFLSASLADPEMWFEWVVSALWPLVLVDWAVSLQFVHVLDLLAQRREARLESLVLSLQVIARVDNLIEDCELEGLLLGDLFPLGLVYLLSDFAYLMLELILKLNLPLCPL